MDVGLIGITALEYQGVKDFHDGLVNHRDARIMGKFAKISLVVAERLYKKVSGSQVDPERIAAVLATSTGDIGSIKEYGELLATKGAVGINPSKFPNVMLSTPLSYITSTLKLKGPSVPLYISKTKMNQAIQYGVIQIRRGRCDTVLVIYVDEAKGCFGFCLEKEETAALRNTDIRIYLK